MIPAGIIEAGLCGVLLVITFPELVESAEDQLYIKQQKYDSEELNAALSSASVFTMQLTQGLAPCFSTMFAEMFNYKVNCQILGTFIIVFTIFYMLFVGFKPYSISLIKKEKS